VTRHAVATAGAFLAMNKTTFSQCFGPPSLQLKVSGWVFHSARINSLAWSPNGQYIASAGLDTNIFIWSLENRTKRINIKSMWVWW
jgi:WD40 repeat protein